MTVTRVGLARTETAIRAELALGNIWVRDKFERGMTVGEMIRLLIRDHLTDHGYRAGEIVPGHVVPLRITFFDEDAHTCLSTLVLLGNMDWRVDEAKHIHVWLESGNSTA